MHIIFNTKHIPEKKQEETLVTTLTISLKASNFLSRVGIYSLFFTVLLWFYLAYPDSIFDGVISDQALEFILLFVLLIVLPFIHELLHLVARPWQIFRDDTYFLIDSSQPILHFYMGIVPGGRITREGYIWFSLLPFLVLTFLPFVMIVTSTWPFPVLFGFLVCQNFSLSTIDVYKAYKVWKRFSFGDVISDGFASSS